MAGEAERREIQPDTLARPGGHYSHAVVAGGLVDIDDWPAFNTLYAAWAGPTRPARAVVPVPRLHYGFRIEIEAVAMAS